MALEDNIGLLPTEQDTSLDFLNPSLVSQAEALARRKAELKQRAIDAAKQAGVFAPAQMQESPGFQSAVTGTKVVMPSASPGKWATYAPLAQQVLSSIEQGSLDKDTSGYARLEADAARKHLATKPPDTASDAEKLQWAQRGAQIPSLAPVMQAYVEDQTVKAPVRRQEQAFKASEGALEREATVTAAQLKAQQEAARALKANETTLKAAEIRAGSKTGPAGTWHEMGPSEDGTGNSVWYNPSLPEGENRRLGPPSKAKEPTPAQQDKQEASVDMIGRLKDVRASFTENVVPRWRSFASGNESLPLGKYLGNETDSKIAATWGDFRAVINQVRHGLFGASLTKGEKAAFDSTTVDSFTKREDVEAHLDKLIGYAEKAARRQAARQQGGKMDPVTGAVTLRGRVVPGTESADPVGKFTGLDNPSVRASIEAAIEKMNVPGSPDYDPNEYDRASRALQSQLKKSSGGATGSWDDAPAGGAKPKFKIIGVR